jgi:hypothetical protein
MADDLEELCGKISLTAGEKQGLKITEGDITVMREKGKRCLVGRLWAGKRTNKEAFQSVLSQIWRIRGGVVFKEIQENLWLFEFEKEDDMRRVKEGRPWSFDTQILVLNDFDGRIAPSKMDFTWSPFWIQVHDVPLLCMTKGVATRIGESRGQVEDVDIAGEGVGWGRCLHIRVILNVMQPLERGRALELEGKTSWVPFKYEKLPQFCFNCGCLVHGERGCPVQKPTRLSTVEGIKQWSTWLRAEEPKRKSAGGWTSQPWEENRQTREGSAGQSSGDGRNRQFSWKETSAHHRNPTSDRIFSFQKQEAARVTTYGKDSVAEIGGESALFLDLKKERKGAEDLEEELGDNWSTFTKGTAAEKGELASGEWEPEKGSEKEKASNDVGPKPSAERSQENRVMEATKEGPRDVNGEVTPMEVSPTVPLLRGEGGNLLRETSGKDDRGTSNLRKTKERTGRSLKGATLRAWKRRARVGETTFQEGNVGDTATFKRKHPQSVFEREDSGRGK